MSQTVSRLGSLVLCFLLSICGATAAPAPEGPATQALRHLVETNPEIRHLLLRSIERAKSINPDPLTNPAQTLEQYFSFIALTERGLPDRLIEPKPKATLYQHMDQSLSYMFFICDQPLPELEGRGYFRNSLQYVEPYNAWVKTFVRSWGAYLDTPESWSSDYLRLAQADESFGLSRGWYEDPSRWKTFNEFFTRRLKSPDQRPIASLTDDSIVVSPSDSIPEGVWAIDSNSHLVAKNGVPIKSGTVNSVEELIGADSQYKQAFAGGTFTHLFLDANDYHHYHFPLSGIIREIRVIPGREMEGGYVTWDAANKRYAFDPSAVGWQGLETRGLVILETPNFGLVALLPIGMTPVSSVVFESALRPGVEVHKGDLMGHFLFGGSDFVMVFQAGYELMLSPPRQAADGKLPHLLMGERLAHLQRIAAKSLSAR